MRFLRLVLQDLVDGLAVAHDEVALASTADRAAKRLGFRWFAYLASGEPAARIISSYPRAWVQHYRVERFDKVDPVVRPSEWPRQSFFWSGDEDGSRSTAEQRLFDEARTYRIHCGVTVPIRGCGNSYAAFTLSADEKSKDFRRYVAEGIDIIQLMGLYYHACVDMKLRLGRARIEDAPLTLRETECLAWAARGKTMAETGQILGITKRTVEFHLDNARTKLDAVTLSQAVAEAIRRDLLPRT